jgi:hypothetical protein
VRNTCKRWRFDPVLQIEQAEHRAEDGQPDHENCHRPF